MLEKLKNIQWIYLLAGLGYALSYPNIFQITIPLIQILAIALLMNKYLSDSTIQSKIRATCLFFVGANSITYYWIPYTLAEFGQLPYYLGIFAWFFFALIIMPGYWSALFWDYLSSKYYPKASFSELARSSWGRLAIALVLTISEYFTPAQFPSYISSPLADWGEYLGLASFGGVPLFSFILFLMAIEILHLYRTKYVTWTHWAAIVLFIIINPFSNPALIEKSNLVLRIVQANISNYLKMSSEGGDFPSSTKVINTYKDLSVKENPDFPRIDLIIWPETAYPFIIYPKENMAPEPFASLANSTDAELFIGSYQESGSPETYEGEYNTAFFIGKDAKLKDTYHKRVLIPFGETLPLGPFTKLASQYLSNIAYFKPGEKWTLFRTHKDQTFISTICYEVLKPELMRTYLNSVKADPDFHINLTNDSWYGDTAEPHQHLLLTKWRALEHRLPIIRSTNTGISTVIGPLGNSIATLGPFIQGNVDVSVPLFEREKTIFQKWGFFATLAIFSIYLILDLLLLHYKREQN